jgi:hypothetical protein
VYPCIRDDQDVSENPGISTLATGAQHTGTDSLASNAATLGKGYFRTNIIHMVILAALDQQHAHLAADLHSPA